MFRASIDINKILNKLKQKQNFNTIDNQRKEDNKNNGVQYSLQDDIDQEFQHLTSLEMEEYFIFFHQNLLGFQRQSILYDTNYSEFIDNYLDGQKYYERDGNLYKKIPLNQEIPEEEFSVKNVPDDIKKLIKNRRLLRENISICSNIKNYLEMKLGDKYSFQLQMIKNLEQRGEFLDACNQLDQCTRNSSEPLQQIGRPILHRVRKAYQKGEISITNLPKVTKFIQSSANLIKNPTDYQVAFNHIKNTSEVMKINWRMGVGIALGILGVALIATSIILTAGIIAAPLSGIALGFLAAGSVGGISFTTIGGYFVDRGRKGELVVAGEALRRKAYSIEMQPISFSSSSATLTKESENKNYDNLTSQSKNPNSEALRDSNEDLYKPIPPGMIY